MEVAKEYSQRASEEREEGAPDHDQALPRHSKGAFPLGALRSPSSVRRINADEMRGRMERGRK